MRRLLFGSLPGKDAELRAGFCERPLHGQAIVQFYFDLALALPVFQGPLRYGFAATKRRHKAVDHAAFALRVVPHDFEDSIFSELEVECLDALEIFFLQ